jgi:hypothetical protein
MSRFGFDISNYEIKGHPIRWFSPEPNVGACPVGGDAAGAIRSGRGIGIALGYGALVRDRRALQRNEFSLPDIGVS